MTGCNMCCSKWRCFVVLSVVIILLAGGVVIGFRDNTWVAPYFHPSPTIRQIHVPRDALFAQRHFSPYRSRFIRSEAELQKFVESLETNVKADPFHEQYWIDRIREFEKQIHSAKIDFDHEGVILIPHREGSGGTKVGLSRLYLRSETLVCNVWRGPFGDSADMAYYCFVLVVRKEEVSEVDVSVDGTHRETVNH
jgi:hypothetical protein